MTTSTLSTDDQFALVYAGIQAVAANCDGAIDDDGVGFNGQDTKFGKRIASVPFEDWSADVKAEAARIAARYRKQIEAGIGLDITTLPVVQEAQGRSTNTVARDQARQIERDVRNANGAIVNRIATVSADSVRLSFPYDSNLVAAVRSLPGRKWDAAAKVWTAVHSQALVDFLDQHRFVVGGEEINVPEPVDTDAYWAEQRRIAEEKANQPNITLLGNDRVRIAFDYDAGLVAAVRSLPGRQYDGSTKTNIATLCPEVLAFAEAHDLKVADEVRQALAEVEVVVSAEQAEKDLRKAVSNLANPADLPADFVNRVLAATEKAQVA